MGFKPQGTNLEIDINHAAIWGYHSFVTSKKPSKVSLVANGVLLFSCFIAILLYPLPSQVAIIAVIAFLLAYTALFRGYGCTMRKVESDKSPTEMDFEGWLFSTALIVLSLFVIVLGVQTILVLL